MIFIATLLVAVVAVTADESSMDKGYCQIVVHHSQWCIGINSQGKARNMPCSNKGTRFHRFEDGSFRLMGRENECLKRGSTRDLVYGSCDGAYTFNAKYMPGNPNPKTYKIYSTHPSYKNEFFDIVGTSPKGDASAILYGRNEYYAASDHYYDLKNCISVQSPMPTPMNTGYCQIVVHYSQWCIGINSRNQARNMPCSNSDTHFKMFPDGSLRLKGKEDNCLKRGNSRDMVYGSCSGAYTFKTKHIEGSPSPNTFMFYSTNPTYSSYFFDIVGRSPKGDASAIFYSHRENYISSDHYYDVKNCEADTGMFVDNSSHEYNKCPADHYCEDMWTSTPCPNGGKSPAGSTSVSQCSRNCVCSQKVVGDAEIDCVALKKACECH